MIPVETEEETLPETDLTTCPTCGRPADDPWRSSDAPNREVCADESHLPHYSDDGLAAARELRVSLSAKSARLRSGAVPEEDHHAA